MGCVKCVFQNMLLIVSFALRKPCKYDQADVYFNSN